MNKLRALPFSTRIFLLALALRLIPVLLTIDLPIGLDDMFQYDMLGRSLASGNGFRWYAQDDLDLVRQYIDFELVAEEYNPAGVLTSFRAPAYPAFLALIYAISGMQWRFFAARLVQAVLGAALAPLTYLLGRQLFPKADKGARWAGWAIAIYPMLLVYPLALATENLFIPLVAAGLLALLRAVESKGDRGYLLAGALFGLATLTRSVIFGFVGLAVLWLWFALKQRRGALLFGMVVLAVITPWVVRNSLLHERFTFIESSAGYNLYMAYHPEGNGGFQFGISLDLLPYLDDAQRDDIGRQAAIRFIREDPGRALLLTARRVGYFFGLERREMSYFYSNGFFGAIPQTALIGLFGVLTLPFVVIGSLSAAGVALIQWDKTRGLALLLIGSYLLPHAIILAEPRFHLTLMPVLAAVAGQAWSERSALWARAKANRGRLWLAVLLLALLWFNWGMELWRDADKLVVLFGPDGWRAGFDY